MSTVTRVCVAGVFFRGVGIKTGECVVPSQPFLEWFCLKVLGAIKLLSCTVNRCSTAFLYPEKNKIKKNIVQDSAFSVSVTALSVFSVGP